MLMGALLTAMGIVALVLGGGMIQYTVHEKIPHDGTTQLTAPQDKVFSIPPVVGGLALAGGVALMVLAARK